MSMVARQDGLNRFAGITVIISGALFLSRAFLDFFAGVPPSTGEEILAWSTSNRTILSIANEVFFFAAVLLVPVVVALYRTLADRHRALSIAGCGLIAVTIPVMAVLDVVHGRLVYPVFGINLHSPETAELVVAVFYGGLHAVGIILGVATIILSLAMRQGIYGRFVVLLGLATGIADIVGAYPFIIGPILTLVCYGFLAAWFIAVGIKLCEMAGGGPSYGE